MFLSEVLPTIYRFGTGDITDALKNDDASRQSGQIDIVIEMPWAPSFPAIVGSGARVYPAETVGTAIEVKSNLSSQWTKVISKATALEPLRQRLSGIAVDGGELLVKNKTEEPIPLYAVGYEGWSTVDTVVQRLRNAPLDGILILKHKIFAWCDRRAFLQRLKQCQDELTKKLSGQSFDSTQAACARVTELIDTNVPEQIVATLNAERWSATTLRFGDGEFLPTVSAGGWTTQNLEHVCKVFLKKTKVSIGIEALLQFVAVVHREIGKRAAMSVDLSEYTK